MEYLANLLRDEIAALRGARNPHVHKRTFRFSRSVRLAPSSLATVCKSFPFVKS
jgi:hypothetical protein